jgi:hypothetical protein
MPTRLLRHSFMSRLFACARSIIELESKPTKKSCQTMFFYVGSKRSWSQGKQVLERQEVEKERYQRALKLLFSCEQSWTT